MTTVKQGDRHPVALRVNADLTGATVRANMRRRHADGALIPFDTTVTDPGAGEITHTLTGALDPGTYELEVEVTRGEEIVTFPTIGSAYLRVENAID